MVILSLRFAIFPFITYNIIYENSLGYAAVMLPELDRRTLIMDHLLIIQVKEEADGQTQPLSPPSLSS